MGSHGEIYYHGRVQKLCYRTCSILSVSIGSGALLRAVSFFLTVAAAAAVLTVSACGGSPSSSSAAASASSAAAAAPATSATTAPAVASSSVPPLPSGPTQGISTGGPTTSGTKLACDMLMENSLLAQLVNTSAAVHIVATGELVHDVYECQVGLNPTASYTHGVEGGVYCNYADPSNLITGQAIATNIYGSKDLPRTYLMIIGPHTAIGITFFLDVNPTPSLVIPALQSAAHIVDREGCPAG